MLPRVARVVMADLEERLISIDGIGPVAANDLLAGAEEAGVTIAPEGDEETVDGEAVLRELASAREHLVGTEGDYADKHIRRAISLLRGETEEE